MRIHFGTRRVVGGLVLLGVLLACLAGVPPFDRLRYRWSCFLIAAENSVRPEHAWGGSFYRGDGLGENVSLDLSPSGEVAALWTGCMGTYDRNFGSVREQEGRLQLSFVRRNAREPYRGFPEELVPVRWGERHYLIEPAELPAFASAVNAGLEPRSNLHGPFLLRRGDEARAVVGKPEVPAEARAWLLDAPLTARVVAVDESPEVRGDSSTLYRARVELDVGRADGAFVGMIFLDRQGEITLTAVEEHSSTAFFETYGATSLPLGWTFRTEASPEQVHDLFQLLRARHE